MRETELTQGSGIWRGVHPKLLDTGSFPCLGSPQCVEVPKGTGTGTEITGSSYRPFPTSRFWVLLLF